MPEQESQSISSEQPDPVEQIERRIFLIRGHKVLLDSDLAKLYGVSTGHLNEQVRRNHGRFPEDFMFVLTACEADALRSQIAISKGHRGGRRYSPFVFTEQGVAMLSSVLNAEQKTWTATVLCTLGVCPHAYVHSSDSGDENSWS